MAIRAPDGANNVSKELSLHPVHLKPDFDRSLPPSALVPFCFYQEDHNLLLPTTFCDKFEPTILEGQLCYSLNVTKSEWKATKTGKKSGLFLLLDPSPYPMKSTDGRVKNAKNDQESFKVYIHTLAGHSAFGAGTYAMQTLKRMTGKPSFFEMRDSQKECQVHSREKCQTEMFLSHLRRNCNCVLWALTSEKSTAKVILIFVNEINQE